MTEARVIEIARAKINLALHVLGRRSDGYHAIDSVVAFAELGDRLILSSSSGSGRIHPVWRTLRTSPARI